MKIFKYKKHRPDKVYVVKSKGYVLVSFYKQGLNNYTNEYYNNIFGKIAFWWNMGTTLERLIKSGVEVEYFE